MNWWRLFLAVFGVCPHVNTMRESVNDVLHLTCVACGHRVQAVTVDGDLTARRERLLERMDRAKADIAAANAARQAEASAAVLAVDLPPAPARVTTLVDCSQCDGDGWVEGDCGEDTCCCVDDHDLIPCQHCHGTGYRSSDDPADIPGVQR